MNREVSDRNILDVFCEDFCKTVEKHCKYIIVSGFLAIASGRTRGTEDIDMIIERLDYDKFEKLFNELNEKFVCKQTDSAKEAHDYLKNNVSVRFTMIDKELPEMEIKFAKDELDTLQIMSRTKLKLTNLDVWFGNINMNIAFKEELLKSPKDMEDAQHLRIVYSDIIDEQKINEFKKLIKRHRLN